ncbi:hypothetical protein TNCV_983891 [Trichonephila clavipes]|nr:hypothetical protein TNCV_983891 [Trichonephila clavipes]
MSRDRNRIEHVRDALGHSTAARKPAPTTIDELKSALVQEKDEIGMSVGGLPTIVEIEIGGMQKFWIDKMIGEIIIEVHTWIDPQRNHGFENRNRIDMDNRGLD